MNIPKQAVEAVIKASYPRTLFISEAELVLTAALPHIRRAVIEELVEKLTNTVPGPNWLGYKAWACDWLRAELEGDDHG